MHQNWVKKVVIALACLIALAAIILSRSSQESADWPEVAKVHEGDRLEWKDTDFDDSQWLSYRQWQRRMGPYRGNLWLRQTLELDPDNNADIFVLVAVGSSEIYFDGRLIGRNGVVGDSLETEVPGSILTMCTIPTDLLEPGTHQVALRFSNHRGIGRFYLLGGGVGNINDVLSFTRRTMFPFLFLSAFVVVALYFLILYALEGRRASHLVFALLCGFTALLLFVESIRALGYPYHWHGYRLLLVVFISGILAGLVPLFFVLRHGMSRRWIAGIPIVMALGALFFYRSPDHFAYGFFLTAFVYAQLVVCVAFWKEEADSWIGLIGVSQVLIALAISGMSFMERWLFGSVTLLIVLTLTSLGLQLRRQRSQFQEARLRSARLQIELLKKHLQPHFMLNTLTAVMEWLEREPKAGVAFIGLLAGEMKTLNRISGLKLVSLDEELALCRNHLEILSYRNDQKIPFHVDCEGPDLQIPPAMILTLVENGISYALDEGIPTFRFRQHITAERQIHMELLVEGVDIKAGETDEGTGSHYIKARLEESFPERWRMDAAGKDQTWTTTIVIEAGS